MVTGRGGEAGGGKADSHYHPCEHHHHPETPDPGPHIYERAARTCRHHRPAGMLLQEGDEELCRTHGWLPQSEQGGRAGHRQGKGSEDHGGTGAGRTRAHP